MRGLFDMSSDEIDREYERQTDRLLDAWESSQDAECSNCRYYFAGCCYKHEDDPDIIGEQVVEKKSYDWCPEYRYGGE